MRLLQSWKDSLKIFTPAHFRLFFLVSVKSTIEMYRLLLRYFWWLLLVALGVSIFYYNINNYQELSWLYMRAWLLIDLMYFCIWFAFIFAVFLIVRPSVKYKDYAYFSGYARHFIYFFIFILFVFLLCVLLFDISYRFGHAQDTMMFKIIWLLYHMLTFVYTSGIGGFLHWLALSPLSIFFILFLLDSPGTFASFIRSLSRSIKMFVYNYPFCLLMFALFAVAFLDFIVLPDCIQGLQIYGFVKDWLINKPIRLVLGLIVVSPDRYAELLVDHAIILLLPIPICFFTNFYIKKVHEQSELYSKLT